MKNYLHQIDLFMLILYVSVSYAISVFSEKSQNFYTLE